MQRIGTHRRIKLIFSAVIPILVCLLCIGLDQFTKDYFSELYKAVGDTEVISGFFYFTYTVNQGAAWSFLADVWWGQTFFKVLTSIALVLFITLFVLSIIKDSKWLSYSFAFIIGGTIGNFIDRLLFNGVVDFIGFIFGSYHFPIFNLADSFLVVGVIMVIIYLLFLDKGRIFKSNKINHKKAKEDNGDQNLSDN